MSQGLPILIEPLDLAHDRIQLKGQYNAAEMPRLAEFCPTDETEVLVQLDFSLESEKVAKLSGSIVTQLNLICERCLKTIDLNMALAPTIYFGGDQQQSEQQEERDILPVEGPVELLALIEDEILLALPMIPMHKSLDCNAEVISGLESKETQQAENPFLKLAALKAEFKKDKSGS